MDEKLIKKAVKGNFNAYSIQVNELKSDGYKLAYTILKNEQDSIDAYLQAVEKGLKNIKNLKEVKYFKTWFLKIVINEAKNIISKNSKVIYLEDVKDLKEDKEINRENKIDLEKSLQSIDPQTREMIKMKYYMGYKLEEIAQILDLSIGMVKGKMYTALKNMRKELSDSENRG